MIYEKFSNKISWEYFSNLWEGYSWPKVHLDVYTDENRKFYKLRSSIGERSSCAIFTNSEVYELRKRYQNETAKEIYQSVKERCSFQTLQQILWGRMYTHMPVWDKRLKIWIIK